MARGPSLDQPGVHQPNALPSSVKDRLSAQYEYLFHFVKSPRYSYDLDAIRVPHKRVFLMASVCRFPLSRQ